MKKRFLTLLGTAFIAVILFSSCAKNNKQGRYIPSQAAVVLHIDGASLNSKLPWEEIKQNDLFKKMSADTNMSAFERSMMDNPENSGIDIKNDLEIFMIKDSSGGYAGFEGTVKDEAKVKAFLGNMHKDAKETTKDGYTYLTDRKACIAYNKERFFVTFDLPMMNYMNNRMGAMSTDTSFGMIEEKHDRDLGATTAMLVGLAEDQSLAKNSKFSELVGTKGDAHIWYNAAELLKGMDMGPMGAMVNAKKLTDGSIFTGTVDFRDGRISFDAKSYLSSEVSDLYKKYSKDGFDKSMVKNIPSQNVAGVMAFSFNPEMIREFLKLMGMDGIANMAMYKMGFTVDDIVKATKGDFVLAATDITRDTISGGDGQFIFAASVGDKASFNKIMDAARKQMHMMPGDADPNGKMNYNTNDKYFVYSNKKSAMDAYLAGSANNSFPFMDKISDGPFGGYVNIQYILKAMQPKAGADSSDLASYDASVKLWDDIVLKGGNYSGGGITQHWEVNLIDKSTNSLKQLNQYAGKMGAIEEMKRKKEEEFWRHEDMTVDTSVMVAPVAPIK